LTKTPPRVCLVLLLFTFLSYFQYPGHTYLVSDTQIYVPMLERFENPTLFARDPMVIRAHTTWTFFDEIAVGFRKLTRSQLETALGLLHFFARWCLLIGIFMIARAMGLEDLPAAACAGIYALGGLVQGPSVLLVEYEPVPRAFALGPAVLGIGLAAEHRFAAAGAAGAAALALHGTTSVPFWIILGAFLLAAPSGSITPGNRLWPFLSLGSALLALKIAAPWQLGVSEPQTLLGRLDADWEGLARLRSPYVFVDLWSRAYFWQYGLMFIAAAAAYWRLRKRMSKELRFFAVGLAFLAVLSLPVSYLLLEKWKWALVLQWQPLRSLLFLQMLTILLALALAMELSCRRADSAGASFWAALAIASAIDSRLLFALTPAAAGCLGRWPIRAAGIALAVASAWLRPFGITLWTAPLRRELCVVLLLSVLLAGAAALHFRSRLGGLGVVLAVGSAFFIVPGRAQFRWSGEPINRDLAVLSDWARGSTDGNAVFLFPDSPASSIDPGVFRARAERALYTDWKSGGQINFFRDFARLWGERWRQALAEPFHPEQLVRLRQAGVDYIVLQSAEAGPALPLAFTSGAYRVYRLK
jgi:hypothetical protein